MVVNDFGSAMKTFTGGKEKRKKRMCKKIKVSILFSSDRIPRMEGTPLPLLAAERCNSEVPTYIPWWYLAGIRKAAKIGRRQVYMRIFLCDW